MDSPLQESTMKQLIVLGFIATLLLVGCCDEAMDYVNNNLPVPEGICGEEVVPEPRIDIEDVKEGVEVLPTPTPYVPFSPLPTPTRTWER